MPVFLHLFIVSMHDFNNITFIMAFLINSHFLIFINTFIIIKSYISILLILISYSYY